MTTLTRFQQQRLAALDPARWVTPREVGLSTRECRGLAAAGVLERDFRGRGGDAVYRRAVTVEPPPGQSGAGFVIDARGRVVDDLSEEA